MLVYHGSTVEWCEFFCAHGIDGDKVLPRQIHGPQDGVPGLYVTPDIEVAKGGRMCVIEIDVQVDELAPGPSVRAMTTGDGLTLAQTLAFTPEPQALLNCRVEPDRIRIVFRDPRFTA